MARAVDQCERILKLLRKRPGAHSAHIEQQAILRVFEIKTPCQLADSVYTLADDACDEKRRRQPAGLISRHTAAGRDQQIPGPSRSAWQDGENILRRQSLFGIKLRDNRTKFWIKKYLEEPVSCSPAPNFINPIVLTA